MLKYQKAILCVSDTLASLNDGSNFISATSKCIDKETHIIETVCRQNILDIDISMHLKPKIKQNQCLKCYFPSVTKGLNVFTPIPAFGKLFEGLIFEI